MKDSDIHKLVSLIEDMICKNVNMDEYEDILPKLSKLLYHRYCSGDNEGLVKDKEALRIKEIDDMNNIKFDFCQGELF